MKILNLYAGIGGNRKLWGPEHKITAVENDPEIARIYQDNFPNDIVIIGDAHQYLLDHYKEFDFIWTSSPCPSHSRGRYWGSGSGKMEPLYPDMKLYQEIIFLKHYFKGKWVSENVDPFYIPIYPGHKIGRHLFWSNFKIGQIDVIEGDVRNDRISDLEELHGFDISSYKGGQRKDKIIRNCVHPNTGEYILNCAMGVIRRENVKQTDLFI